MKIIILLKIIISIIIFNLATAFQYDYDQAQLTSNYWNDLALTTLRKAQSLRIIDRKAKNVILFLGDGMGISTITASRILKGQLQNKAGEDSSLVFENFPHISLIKTYNVDRQVPDSAGTATAFLCGVKANYYTIGLNANVKMGDTDCEAILKNSVPSILQWAIDADKSAGFVTTTRVTHATPSASYAHTSHRDWEHEVPTKVSSKCKDIARQLVEDEPGSKLNVILGGGRRHLLSKNDSDHMSGRKGKRTDNRNLIKEWLQMKKERTFDQDSYAFVNSTRTLRNINIDKIQHLFGSFDYSNMDYDMERDHSLDGQPSLEEMTETALKILLKNQNGFVLLVEGGRIDHAHHDNYGALSLYETLAFDKAINKALSMVDIDETLIIVTADHSHTFTINGYPFRGNPILGTVKSNFNDVPFTTLIYANGPGYNESRINKVQKVNTSELRYAQLSAINLPESAHAGEDVALYSIGPMSHLFQGTQEQSYVAHVIGYASCIGTYKYERHCFTNDKSPISSADHLKINTFKRLFINFLIMLVKLL